MRIILYRVLPSAQIMEMALEEANTLTHTCAREFLYNYFTSVVTTVHIMFDMLSQQYKWLNTLVNTVVV